MNTTGQIITPAVIVSPIFSTPKIVQSNLSIPNNPSTENSLVPIIYAIIALAIKNPPRIKKRRLILFDNIDCITIELISVNIVYSP